MSKTSIARVTLVVADYDDALNFYINALGFLKIDDSPLDEHDSQGRQKRWVVVAPRDSACQLLLARASNDEEIRSIGNQTGGRVSFFLYTDDFAADYKRFRANGVEFMETEPRAAPYGTVIVFRDICGNLWDLLEPTNFLQT